VAARVGRQTVNRLRVIDFCCGIGGQSAGFARAGAEVIGSDINPQPNYPYPFFQGDFTKIGPGLIEMYKPDLVIGGPPCQAACTLTLGTNQGREYPQLIPAFRDMCEQAGVPYVIENPPGRAPMRRDVMLCGEMFGLDVTRHRYFEIGGGLFVPQPHHPKHRGRTRGWRHGRYYDGPYVAVYGDGGGKGSVAEWQQAMGIDWTGERREIREAIPPAYGFYLAEYLLPQLQPSEAAA
jgi:hypothetical protein